VSGPNAREFTKASSSALRDVCHRQCQKLPAGHDLPLDPPYRYWSYFQKDDIQDDLSPALSSVPFLLPVGLIYPSFSSRRLKFQATCCAGIYSYAGLLCVSHSVLLKCRRFREHSFKFASFRIFTTGLKPLPKWVLHRLHSRASTGISLPLEHLVNAYLFVFVSPSLLSFPVSFLQ